METHTLWEDCLIIHKDIPDNSIDAVITDPPYEINFMLRLGINQGSPTTSCSDMNFFVPLSQVLILAFGGTRTYHRMACAVEDSGFEIRDIVHRLSKDNVLELVREFSFVRK